MLKKDTTINDFVLALSEAVKAAIGSISNDMLKELLDRIQQQEAENVALETEVKDAIIRIIFSTTGLKLYYSTEKHLPGLMFHMVCHKDQFLDRSFLCCTRQTFAASPIVMICCLISTLTTPSFI